MKEKAMAGVLAILVVLSLVLTIRANAPASNVKSHRPEEVTDQYDVTDAFAGAVYATGGKTESERYQIIGRQLPTAGLLTYEDLKLVEKEARRLLKCGLGVRQALSPYQGNLDFETYVKKFDLGAGFEEEANFEDFSDQQACFPGTETLGDVIKASDETLREARDLYAFLLVFAQEHRFRADDFYLTTPQVNEHFPDLKLCDATGEQEDPDPKNPDPNNPEVLTPVIDWCNFKARFRQTVREAAHLRLIFGQQFMADAMGLHFSGVEFFGGEEMVRQELAQLRAAAYQFEHAEAGLSEGLERMVGNGCYVSDFYTQSEWSLLSRAISQQETARHHIATRLSYLDVDNPQDLPQVQEQALDTFRQASTDGYIKVVGLAGLGATSPRCAAGERPDGQQVADMALNLRETRRKALQMADGRNIFGFDVTFTPARFFENSGFETCEATGPGERGLWDEAYCAARYAKELQNDEVAASRAFDDSQKELLKAVEGIRNGIDDRVASSSGCTKNSSKPDDPWTDCVKDQKGKLDACRKVVDSKVTFDEKTGEPNSDFDNCMKEKKPLDGSAKQALYDLRSNYVDYHRIKIQAENINDRIGLSDSRNAKVIAWLATAGSAKTAAQVAQETLRLADCLEPVASNDAGEAVTSTTWNAKCAWTGGITITAQAIAGALSTAADVEIENARQHEEVQNMLLNMSELLIEAYGTNQQFYAKMIEYQDLLDGMLSDAQEAKRQRAYFKYSPANDPSVRIVRDSARMVLASQLEYAARMSYLAARRAEYEYAARLSASNFRISDIYRSRTADDILKYLQAMRGRINNLPGSKTNARDLNISVAQHVLLWTDEALAKEGFTTPEAAEAERVRRFRLWVSENTVSTNDGDALRIVFPTSLLEGGLFSNLILQNYDGYWLHKLAGVGEPLAQSHGVSLNILTEQPGLSFRETQVTQAGEVHLRSQAGCIFDYKLIAPAWLLGYDWAENQDPEAATAVFRANVNDGHAYSENGFRAAEFNGRAVSSTAYEIIIFAGKPEVGLPDMDLGKLTDIELIISTTYASRTPGAPNASQCTRIDW